jgi:hypothetical protein
VLRNCNHYRFVDETNVCLIFFYVFYYLKFHEKTENNSPFSCKGFLGILFAFAGAMLGNPMAVGEGIQAALEAGIKIAEIMEDLLVFIPSFL